MCYYQLNNSKCSGLSPIQYQFNPFCWQDCGHQIRLGRGFPRYVLNVLPQQDYIYTFMEANERDLFDTTVFFNGCKTNML